MNLAGLLSDKLGTGDLGRGLVVEGVQRIVTTTNHGSDGSESEHNQSNDLPHGITLAVPTASDEHGVGSEGPPVRARRLGKQLGCDFERLFGSRKPNAVETNVAELVDHDQRWSSACPIGPRDPTSIVVEHGETDPVFS